MTEEGDVRRIAGESEQFDKTDKVTFEGYAVTPDVIRNALCL